MEKWPNHPYPTSLPTQNIISLKISIEKILEEGIKNVEARHYRVSRKAYEYVKELKFKKLPRDGCESLTLTVFLLPNNYNAIKIAETLNKEYGILISTTWLLKMNGLRIGHMGYTAKEKYIDKVFKALQEVIKH